MRKRMKGLILGILIGVMLISGTVFAKQATETISVMYDNIKIFIDGVEYTPKDANGNVVEPFIYKGTTYLPVRGIANAFSKDVSWEPQTSTIKLGSINYDWLDQMGYANYETSDNKNKIEAWVKGWVATDDVKYDRGISLLLGYGNNGAKINNDNSAVSYQNIEYLLNSNYKMFSGKLLCKRDARNDQNAIVKIYGDGNLIYSSPILTAGTKPIDFNIDVSQYKMLKINASIPNLIYTGYGGGESIIGIVDARLAKK